MCGCCAALSVVQLGQTFGASTCIRLCGKLVVDIMGLSSWAPVVLLFPYALFFALLFSSLLDPERVFVSDTHGRIPYRCVGRTLVSVELRGVHHSSTQFDSSGRHARLAVSTATSDVH